jgi:DNA-binding NarL/FixJ family response regulator
MSFTAFVQWHFDRPRPSLYVMAREDSPEESLVLLRVLVADSGSSVNDGLTALLSEMDGISVFGCAQNSGKVLALARSLRPDVVILDVQRTEPINLDILQMLKAIPGAPIVIALCNEDSLPLRGAVAASSADHDLLRTDSEGLVGLISGYIANRKDQHGSSYGG